MKKLFSILTIGALLLSCKKENNCLIAAGDKTTETVYLEPFSSIQINHFLNVNWIKSSEYKINIEAGDNFVIGVSSEISDGLLTLTNNNGCKMLRRNINDILVTVYCPQIDSLTLKGNGNITFKDTLKSNLVFSSIANQASVELLINNSFTKFYLESGSTDITVKGNNSYCDYYNSGIVHFLAKDFKVDSFRCHSRANGITEIRANSWLHIEQNGNGDINYWGNPTVVNVSSYLGEGKIIKR